VRSCFRRYVWKCVRDQNALMTQLGRVLSSVAFFEVLEWTAEDPDNQPMHPIWRLREGASWGWLVLWAQDPE
jgi:hypothetical protein